MKSRNKISDIKELPIEKMIKRGPDSLSDAELLAIILQTGTATCSVFELSEKVMELSGRYGRGMLGLYSIPMESLCGIPGIGRFKSCRLKAVAEISKRIHETDAFSKISYDSPSSIADMYMEKMRHEQVEEVMIVMFDNRLHMLGEKCLSKGTVSSAVISPREIFIYALEHHAVHIILIHNHPSGDVTPSENDVDITERVKETGKIIGITLLDHIIIGDRRYMSFKEKGFLQ